MDGTHVIGYKGDIFSLERLYCITSIVCGSWKPLGVSVKRSSYAGNLAGNSAVNAAGNSVGNAAGQGGRGKAYLRKAVIGGNLAFAMGDGELTNQHPAQQICWKILWEILQEIFRTYPQTNFEANFQNMQVI